MIEAAERIQSRLRELAACTDGPGLTRLYLSPAHRRATGLVRGWMEEAGLRTRLDDAATLVGTRPGADGIPALLLGSHLDTVRDAGRYDGCLGVLAAIELAHAAPSLPYPVEVRAFGDEEGVRFPATLTGSRSTAGRFDPACLDLADIDGITLRDALASFGLDPDRLARNQDRARAFAYLELHIEQGPVLEHQDRALAVVTGIASAARLAVEVTGRAGPAGPVPMHLRQDALAAAASMVTAVREAPRGTGGVATVGQITVAPGAVNVIPGHARFTVDLRAPTDAEREALETRIRARLRRVAEAERITLDIALTHQAAAAPCDGRLRRLLARCMADPIELASFAGHDAMAIAPLCPIGLLFVRCAGGISHHPDESASTADVAAALTALLRTLQALDPAEFDRS